ncbi:MAG: hypothetical protein EOS67_24130 [Mesorhizobium sp.]|nr:MAG: hypothetical protein EOS67_24130 [Mesorhizobium sp.]
MSTGPNQRHTCLIRTLRKKKPPCGCPTAHPAAVTDPLLLFIGCYQIPVSARMAIAAGTNQRQREVPG